MNENDLANNLSIDLDQEFTGLDHQLVPSKWARSLRLSDLHEVAYGTAAKAGAPFSGHSRDLASEPRKVDASEGPDDDDDGGPWLSRRAAQAPRCHGKPGSNQIPATGEASKKPPEKPASTARPQNVESPASQPAVRRKANPVRSALTARHTNPNTPIPK